MLCRLMILAFLVLGFSIDAQHTEIIVKKYKQYESIDLGDSITIDGNILTPGDISIDQRQVEVYSGELFERKNFKDVIKADLRDLY